METITIILGLVMLVFGILQIILFFKLWGMTNDISSMKRDLNLLTEIAKKFNQQPPSPLYQKNVRYPIEVRKTIFSVGDIVISKNTGRRLIVNETGLGQYLCIDEETGEIDRVYKSEELSVPEK